MRTLLFIIILALASSILINLYCKRYMGIIEFPQSAHNNTIAQMPIFEGMDDGEKYFKHIDIQYCDEISAIYTCFMRPGQTRDVLQRILDKKFLKNCKLALKSQKESIDYCIKDCKEQIPSGEHYGCFDYCNFPMGEPVTLPPECDKELMKKLKARK